MGGEGHRKEGRKKKEISRKLEKSNSEPSSHSLSSGLLSQKDGRQMEILR